MEVNDITGTLVNIFLKVHKELGPGLLESVYQGAVCYELTKSGMLYMQQQGIPVHYQGKELGLGFRADIIVYDKVIVEIKSVEQIAPVHFKTLLTYLKLSDIRAGLLVNFNVALIKDGIKRVVNGL